ncbi:MAG TPA: YeeE/YedE thiosulfate transporter family protein, partial [Burkholderiales bacterium]
AGLLVGFGTRMGGGCTSGHGVCGLGRFSLRSLVAVITFMASGIAAAYAVRHLLGVAS